MDRFILLFCPEGDFNSCVSIKLWESVHQLKLIAKAAMKMKWKCPVYISDLSSVSVDFFQLSALSIELLPPFNHF